MLDHEHPQDDAWHGDFSSAGAVSLLRYLSASSAIDFAREFFTMIAVSTAASMSSRDTPSFRAFS